MLQTVDMNPTEMNIGEIRSVELAGNKQSVTRREDIDSDRADVSI